MISRATFVGALVCLVVCIFLTDQSSVSKGQQQCNQVTFPHNWTNYEVHVNKSHVLDIKSRDYGLIQQTEFVMTVSNDTLYWKRYQIIHRHKQCVIASFNDPFFPHSNNIYVEKHNQVIYRIKFPPLGSRKITIQLQGENQMEIIAATILIIHPNNTIYAYSEDAFTGRVTLRNIAKMPLMQIQNYKNKGMSSWIINRLALTDIDLRPVLLVLAQRTFKELTYSMPDQVLIYNYSHAYLEHRFPSSRLQWGVVYFCFAVVFVFGCVFLCIALIDGI